MASVSENNQQNQNNQNADLQNIIPAENSNLNPELTAENPEKNNQNLVENNSQIAIIDKTQPPTHPQNNLRRKRAQTRQPQLSLCIGIVL